MQEKIISSEYIEPSVSHSVCDYYNDLAPTSDYLADISFIIGEAEYYFSNNLISYKQTISRDKLAVVLDIDETSLSNYPSFKRDNFANDLSVQVKRYIAADAPAIQPVLNFYKKLKANDVAIFFITARQGLSVDTQELKYYTAKNLQRAGFADYANLCLIPKDNKFVSTVEFKTDMRKELSEQGYRIIFNIGDQPSDLEGGYAEHVVKLPNYLYPATEENFFQSLVSKKTYSKEPPKLSNYGFFNNKNLCKVNTNEVVVGNLKQFQM